MSSSIVRSVFVAIMAAVCAAMIPGAAEAAARFTAGAITGVVVSEDGSPVPAAVVTLSELRRSVTTDGSGRFVFRSVPPGEYHVDVSRVGFAPTHQEVTVPVEGDVQITITLRVTPLELSGLQVTASAAAADALELTQATTEMSGQKLLRRLGSSVAASLADEPGLATRYNGPAASVPVIRGLTGERVLLLKDGQRSGDLAATSADHAPAVDPLAAQRIEVVRGPASLLYGNNALGGVVNVISEDIPTAVPSHVDGYLALHAESVNPGAAASGAATFPLGGTTALRLRGGGRRLDDVRPGGDGVLPNSYARNGEGVASLAHVGERFTVGGAYQFNAFDYGLPAPPDAEEIGVHIQGTRHLAEGKAELQLANTVVPSIRIDATAQWYEHDEIEPEGEVGTTFGLKTQTVNVMARTAAGRFTGAFGLWGLLRQYDATGEEALTPGADSRNGALLLFQSLPLGGAEDARGGARDAPRERTSRIEFGARFDIYAIETRRGDERFGPPTTIDFGNVSASVGVSVPVGSEASFGVTAARSFRAPTVEELFSNGFHAATASYDVGDSDLDPETNAGLDAVLRAQSARVNAQLSGFYSRIDDFIFPGVAGDTVSEEGATVPILEYEQADARLLGAEAQAEFVVARNVVLSGKGDFVRGEFRSGGPLPFMPAARVGASARWDDGRFTAGVEVLHAFDQDDVPDGERAVGAYTRVDASAGLRVTAAGRVHSIVLRADNLFDVAYRDATSRIKDFALSPGRNLALVYKVLF